MRAGDGLIAHGQALAREAALAQCVEQKLRAVCIVRVRDADLLGLVGGQLLVEVGQRGERLLAAARLAALDDLALIIAAQQRLDLEHGADNGGSLAHAAAALEIGEVINCEVLAHGAAALGDLLHDEREGCAVFEHTRSLEHQQPLAERGGIGVNGGNLPLRELLLQLFHGHGGSVCRAADAAGHADVDHVVSGGQCRMQRLQKSGEVNHGGGHGRTAAHGVIVSLAVKIDCGILLCLHAVNGIVQRDNTQGIFLNVSSRQVCRRVCEDLDHESAPLLAQSAARCALYIRTPVSVQIQATVIFPCLRSDFTVSTEKNAALQSRRAALLP